MEQLFKVPGRDDTYATRDELQVVRRERGYNYQWVLRIDGRFEYVHEDFNTLLRNNSLSY